MSDFKSYKQKPSKQPNFTEKEKKDVESLVSNYENMSQDEMTAELKKVYAKEKKSGNMSEEKLNKIAQTIGGYLSEEQKAKMQNIIKMLEK